MPVQSAYYIKRRADTGPFEGLLAGELCYVLNARQMGKSSLSVRTMAQLTMSGVRTVFLDLTRIGVQNVTPEQWYMGLLQATGRALGLRREMLEYWKLISDRSLAERYFGALRDVVLEVIPAEREDAPRRAAESQVSVVIFIDGGILEDHDTVTTSTGTLALVKTGTGILTLTGASTYTGGSLVNKGTLAATGTALGTGLVSIASGATLAVGDVADTTTSAQTTSKLTIGALSVTGGGSSNSVSCLTFNLGANNTSDMLSLKSLAFSGSSPLDLDFASATGGAGSLVAAGSTYDLLTFASPSAGDVTGLDTSTAGAANTDDFQALGAGNLSGGRPSGGTFAWTFVGASASMPEPPAGALLVFAAYAALPGGILRCFFGKRSGSGIPAMSVARR